MKYYDISTRKRPEFNSVWDNAIRDGIKVTGKPYIFCECGIAIVKREIIFDHWQQGHFDVYDEVKDRKEYSVSLDKLNREQ